MPAVFVHAAMSHHLSMYIHICMPLGKLEPAELIEPLIEMLGGLAGGGPPPTPEQCLGFAGMFDQVSGPSPKSHRRSATRPGPKFKYFRF